MSDIDKKYVPEGVFLVCDKGEIVTQLLANPERNVFIYGAKKCTEADNKFEQNILPFGKCKTCGTCKFTQVEWTKTKQNVKINGSYALLEDSEGICKEGQGIIKIYFDEYLAILANENQNESAFVKESISSEILGTVLTTPFGKVIDLFCADDNKFTEGVGRGLKKGMEGTWNFLTSDMWKADTWKGMGKLAVIGAAYSSPVTGMLMGDTTLQSLDNVFGTDFKQTKDDLVDGVKKTAGNAWEDVKRGNMGEVGESYGQLQYAVVEALAGTKGAGLVLKGATTGAKALIGAERLAQVAATAFNWMSKLKAGALGFVKTGNRLADLKRAMRTFNPLTATSKQKGNFGEMASHMNMSRNKNLTLIGNNPPSTLNDKLRQGIDGIYENSKPPPKYIINEAKYGTGKLKKTKDGKQMSDDWIKGNERLQKQVGKKKAENIKEAIRKGEVDKVLSEIDETGKVTTYKLDADGNKIGKWNL